MVSRQPYPLDHATHIPVLIGIGRSFPHIKRVFEFGAGLYSTPLFLNKSVFPNVEEVITIEPDLEWQKKVMGAVKEDPRLVLYDVSYSLDPTVDLVFIDDGPLEQRIKTIQETVAEYWNGLIVVHDSQEPAYKEAMKLLRYRYDFTAYNPETSVGINGVPIPIRYIDRIMQRCAGTTNPGDVAAWQAIYSDVENWAL